MTVDTYSQEFMWQCLVRQVLKWRAKDRAKAVAFLQAYEQKHKTTKLSDDVKTQWRLGNEGEDGVWLTS